MQFRKNDQRGAFPVEAMKRRNGQQRGATMFRRTITVGATLLLAGAAGFMTAGPVQAQHGGHGGGGHGGGFHAGGRGSGFHAGGHASGYHGGHVSGYQGGYYHGGYGRGYGYRHYDGYR